MIEFIFTIDYEIFGNGLGSLRELVYEPSERLLNIFTKNHTPLVFFIEVAELEMIEKADSDPAIKQVKKQINQIRKNGLEIGLHIHPQWYGAKFKEGRWVLNFEEYNLCLLSEDRINEVVMRAINYLRYVIDDFSFSPVSFRAGNWLMTPTERISRVLSRAGLKIDSSVFKGGYQSLHGLDYRRAPASLYYWQFSHDVNSPDPAGLLLEIPIFTKMIPTWKFISGKRLDLEKKAKLNSSLKDRIAVRLRDFFRFKVPMKFDFCRLNYKGLVELTETLAKEDSKSPLEYKPIVLIGHTKDDPDYLTIESFLSYLKNKGITITSFEHALKMIHQKGIK